MVLKTGSGGETWVLHFLRYIPYIGISSASFSPRVRPPFRQVHRQSISRSAATRAWAISALLRDANVPSLAGIGRAFSELTIVFLRVEMPKRARLQPSARGVRRMQSLRPTQIDSAEVGAKALTMAGLSTEDPGHAVSTARYQVGEGRTDEDTECRNGAGIIRLSGSLDSG